MSESGVLPNPSKATQHGFGVSLNESLAILRQTLTGSLLKLSCQTLRVK